MFKRAGRGMSNAVLEREEETKHRRRSDDGTVGHEE